MPKFIIYSKGDDTEHTVGFERYALKDIPRPNDDADQFAADGYIHFANIAAIIPK
jgi:hypothetical protein